MPDIFPDLTHQSYGGTKVQNERLLSETLLMVDLLASSDDQPTVPAEPRKRRRLDQNMSKREVQVPARVRTVDPNMLFCP